MQYHDPNIGARIQAEGMRINAESKIGQRHRRRGGSGRIAVLVKLVVMIGLIVAFFWWVFS